jgi:valyl-tRNA synthetase
VPQGAKVPVRIVGSSPETGNRVETHLAALTRLARLGDIESATEVPPGSAQIVVGEATYALPLAGVIDLSAERQRLQREIGKLDDEIAKIDKKLGNQQFVSKAPPEVIEEQRERRADAEARRARLVAALARLS